MADREKYIEVLSKAVKTVKEYNEDAPIKISLECIEDILELLKQQEAVVRCKDCKRHYEHNCEIWNDGVYNPEWFCADGERKEAGT